MLSSVENLEERGRNLLLRLLEGGPKTSQQLKQALVKAEIPEPIATSLIGRFQEVELVDDKKFAEDLAAASRRTKGLGRSMISRKLADKGISSEVIEGVVADISEADEITTATELAIKRLGQLSRFDSDTRMRRLVGFLQRRGFSSQVVFAAIREAEAEAVKSEV